MKKGSTHVKPNGLVVTYQVLRRKLEEGFINTQAGCVLNGLPPVAREVRGRVKRAPQRKPFKAEQKPDTPKTCFGHPAFRNCSAVESV